MRAELREHGPPELLLQPVGCRLELARGQPVERIWRQRHVAAAHNALLDRLTHHIHILELNGDSFRLYAGGAELGAAWHQESKDGETPFLAVKLDDPSFAQPMRAAFFENAKEGTGVLVWNRPK
ncbi:MAG: DUF736 family protein [Hyphomonas sp.]